MSYLEMESLQKSFGETPVLLDFSLSVNRGEFVTLLGPSGCGKTTTLRILAGLEKLDGGRIHLEEREITATPSNERQISMVFQSYALFPNLNVFGNVAFGLWARRVDTATTRQTVMELLDLVGLSGLERRFPHELSGGQQQRVALARALAPHPKVLLLDEPLSAVDAVTRARLREEIRKIQRSLQITTVMVTHDQEEALAVSDRVVVMRSGRIEQVGTPQEVYRFPANHFVARFVGASNLLPVRYEANTRRGFFRTHPLILPPVSLNGKDKETYLHIRPEVLRLGRKDTSRPADWNALSGRILWRTFFGPVTRFEVAMDAETVIMVDVPSSEADSWKEGEEVQVLFEPDKGRILEEKEEAHHERMGLHV